MTTRLRHRERVRHTGGRGRAGPSHRTRRHVWRQRAAAGGALLVLAAVAWLYAWLARTDPDASLRVMDGGAPAAAARAMGRERTAALRPVSLPADDAPHTSTMEWWYYNGHLRTAAGARYAFHVAVFLNDGMVRHTVLHASLTDLQTGRRLTRQWRTAGLPSSVSLDGFDFRHAGWRVAGSAAAHSIAFADKDLALTLELRDAGDPVLHRGADSATPGLLDFGAGGISYYYSRPRMAASGTVMVDGVAQAVSGEVWFDHQCGDFDGAGLGWTWFALQLEDGTDLMVYDLFDAKGQHVLTSGTASKHGNPNPADALGTGAVRLRPTHWWTSPNTGISYPISWEITLPSGVITVTPLRSDSEFDARESTFNVYWEGPVQVGGAHAGQGFLELSGYDRRKPTPTR